MTEVIVSRLTSYPHEPYLQLTDLLKTPVKNGDGLTDPEVEQLRKLMERATTIVTVCLQYNVVMRCQRYKLYARTGG